MTKVTVLEIKSVPGRLVIVVINVSTRLLWKKEEKKSFYHCWLHFIRVKHFNKHFNTVRKLPVLNFSLTSPSHLCFCTIAPKSIITGLNHVKDISQGPCCGFWEWHWWTVLPGLLGGGLWEITYHEGREHRNPWRFWDQWKKNQNP